MTTTRSTANTNEVATKISTAKDYLHSLISEVETRASKDLTSLKTDASALLEKLEAYI